MDQSPDKIRCDACPVLCYILLAKRLQHHVAHPVSTDPASILFGTRFAQEK